MGIRPAIWVTLAIAVLIIIGQALVPDQRPDEGALNSPPAVDAIAAFQTIDHNFQAEIAACELGVGLGTIGQQIGTSTNDLYATAQKGAAACRQAAQNIRQIGYPPSVDQARAARLREAMNKCADAMETIAYVEDKRSAFLNSDRRPKDVYDLKGVEDFGLDESTKCYDGYNAIVSSLGLKAAGEASSQNPHRKEPAAKSAARVAPTTEDDKPEVRPVSSDARGASRPWFMVIAPLGKDGNPIEAYTARQMEWHFPSHAACMREADGRAAALASAGMHGNYLCMYHDEPDAELQASAKVTF